MGVGLKEGFFVQVFGVNKNMCGDGFRDEGRQEQCDDGNSKSGDGCSETCEIESSPTQYSCTVRELFEDGDQCSRPFSAGEIVGISFAIAIVVCYIGGSVILTYFSYKKRKNRKDLENMKLDSSVFSIATNNSRNNSGNYGSKSNSGNYGSKSNSVRNLSRKSRKSYSHHRQPSHHLARKSSRKTFSSDVQYRMSHRHQQPPPMLTTTNLAFNPVSPSASPLPTFACSSFPPPPPPSPPSDSFSPANPVILHSISEDVIDEWGLDSSGNLQQPQNNVHPPVSKPVPSVAVVGSAPPPKPPMKTN